MTPKSLAEVAGSRGFPRKDTERFAGSLPKTAWIHSRGRT